MVFVIDFPMMVILIIIGLGTFYFLLVLYESYFTRKLRKKYKEDTDLSKNGEKNREKIGRIPYTEVRTRYPPLPTSTSPDREPVTKGFDKLEGRELLQTTSSDDVGKNSNVDGKTSRGIDKFRGIFKRGK